MTFILRTPIFRRHHVALAAVGLFFFLIPLHNAHADPGVPDHITFTQVPGDPVAANGTFTVLMEVRDTDGAVVTGPSGAGYSATLVLLDNNSNGGTLSGTLTRTSDTNGVLTFSGLSIDQPGTNYTLDATSISGGLFLETTSDPFSVHGSAAYMNLQNVPSSSPAGTLSSCPQLVLYDSLDISAVGDSSTQATVAIDTNPGAGSLGGTLTQTATNGLISFCDLTLNTPGTSYTLIFSSSGLSSVTSGSISVYGAATKLGLSVQPSSVASTTSNGTLGIKVLIQDSGGNTVANDGTSHPVTLAIGTNPGGGTLSVNFATLTRTDTLSGVDGEVDFADAYINAQGIGYTLTASATGLTSTTSNAFTIYGTPTQVAFTGQPADSSPVTGGFVSCVQAAIKDSLGTTVTNATHPITLAIGTNPGSGTLGGTLTRAASSGAACFYDLVLTTAGVGYTLTAASPGLTTATSNSFTISAGTATKLGITTQPSATTAGSAITTVVVVRDAYNNTKLTDSSTSVTVAIGTNAGSGTLSGTLTKTVTNGVATFNDLAIDNAGTGYTLTATASGLTSTTSDAFNVTAVASGNNNSGGGGSSGGSGYNSAPPGTVPTVTLPPPGAPITPAVFSQALQAIHTAALAILQKILALMPATPLPPSPATPPAPPTAPAPTFTRDLPPGAYGDAVTRLQQFLVSKNVGPKALELKAHGLTKTFGPLTEAALAEFQKSVGLPATGFLGPKTRAYLAGQ